MDKERLQTISTLLVTLALLIFAYLLLEKAFEIAEAGNVDPAILVQGVMTLATAIIMAAVARWLQQGAQQAAEKQADKIQEAVANAVTSTNGSSSTSADTVNVDADKAIVNER